MLTADLLPSRRSFLCTKSFFAVFVIEAITDSVATVESSKSECAAVYSEKSALDRMLSSFSRLSLLMVFRGIRLCNSRPTIAETSLEIGMKPPQQNLWADAGSGSRPSV